MPVIFCVLFVFISKPISGLSAGERSEVDDRFKEVETSAGAFEWKIMANSCLLKSRIISLKECRMDNEQFYQLRLGNFEKESRGITGMILRRFCVGRRNQFSVSRFFTSSVTNESECQPRQATGSSGLEHSGPILSLFPINWSRKFLPFKSMRKLLTKKLLHQIRSFGY